MITPEEIVKYIDELMAERLKTPSFYCVVGVKDLESQLLALNAVRFFSLGVDGYAFKYSKYLEQSGFGPHPFGFSYATKFEEKQGRKPTEQEEMDAFREHWKKYEAWRDEQIKNRD